MAGGRRAAESYRSKIKKQHTALSLFRNPHLLESLRFKLFGVRCDDEEQEGRVDGPSGDKLEHHRRLHLRQALVQLCGYTPACVGSGSSRGSSVKRKQSRTAKSANAWPHCPLCGP